jgi:hypothetical protein
VTAGIAPRGPLHAGVLVSPARARAVNGPANVLDPCPASATISRLYDPMALGSRVVIPVLGAHQQAGASGVALTVADVAARAGLRALLVDCADPARSGLAWVCHAEGRSVGAGEGRVPIRVAVRQTSDLAQVAVRRLVGHGSPMTVEQVPVPTAWALVDPEPRDLAIVDIGWDVWRLMTASTHVGPLAWCMGPPAATFPILVMRATVASVALAEAVLVRYQSGVSRAGLVGLHGLAVVGASRWPVQARAVMGSLLGQVAPRAVFFGHDDQVAVEGWSVAPTPTALQNAASVLLSGVDQRVDAALVQIAQSRRRRRLF